MNKALMLRIPLAFAISIALALIPQSSFAQHGGYRGGGFHPRGFASHGRGFGAFHGGGGFGGFHNGGAFGFNNGIGFSGFRNRFGFAGFGTLGFPGFYGPFNGGFRGDYGYGLTFNFGFVPYWATYPPFYGYAPGWVPPYYPYYYRDGYVAPYDGRGDADWDYPANDRCLPDYRHEDRCNDSSPDTPGEKRESAPEQPSSSESSSGRNYVTTKSKLDYRTSIHTVSWTPGSTSSLQLGHSTPSSQIRPALENAIHALRAMPPEARKRQLESDRYRNFSRAERDLMNQASQSELWNNQ